MEAFSRSADSAITINLKLADESVRPVAMGLGASVAELKRAAFQKEIEAGQTAILVFQGKFMKDSERLSSFSLFDQCFVHAVLNSVQRSEPPVDEEETDLESIDSTYSAHFLAALQLAAAQRSVEIAQEEEEGTNFDLAWGVLFGFLLHVLMILCFVSGRLNKKQKVGVVIGICLQMVAVMFARK